MYLFSYGAFFFSLLEKPEFPPAPNDSFTAIGALAMGGGSPVVDSISS